MMQSQPSVDPETTNFNAPVKKIFDTQGTIYFQSSIAIQRLKFFINKYVALVRSTPLQVDVEPILPIVNDIISVLAQFSVFIDEIPPLKGPRRYGNLSCRKWHDRINGVAFNKVKMLVQQNSSFVANDSLILELTYYLQNCFGSKTRLDFGTGHELSFVSFIAALDMLHLLEDITANDFLLIFQSYYKLIKKLIITYTLEPAGSHGVWGLDDHFHFVYILGASQWMDMGTDMRPIDMLNRNLIVKFDEQNFYCQAILFIFIVKSGPFNEHSPILYDISKRVKYWHKVLSGLLKMYNEEVLKKFPVVQHFWFGTGFYPWVDHITNKPLSSYENSSENEVNTELDMEHNEEPSIHRRTNRYNDIDTQRVHIPVHHPQTIGQITDSRTRATSPLHPSPLLRSSNPTSSPTVINNTINQQHVPHVLHANDRIIRPSMAPPTNRVINSYLANARTVRTLPPRNNNTATHTLKKPSDHPDSHN